MMPANSPPFSPIPEKIANRAKNLFGNGNIYLHIGNQIDDLFDGLFSENTSRDGGSPIESICLVSLISAIQYEEESPDMRFIEALRARIEIKYALHLPEDHSYIDSIWLSGLRQQLSAEPPKIDSFQELLNRLKLLGLFCRNPGRSYDAAIVIKTIQIASLMERVVQSMYVLLEKLATEDAEWLRGIVLSQWYTRYNRTAPIVYWPDFNSDWQSFPIMIGKDLRYLLDKIDHSSIQISDGLPTLLNLRQSWIDLEQTIRYQ